MLGCCCGRHSECDGKAAGFRCGLKDCFGEVEVSKAGLSTRESIMDRIGPVKLYVLLSV